MIAVCKNIAFVYDPPSPSKNAYRLAEQLESEYMLSNERVHFVFCKWADSLRFANLRQPIQECIPLGRILRE